MLSLLAKGQGNNNNECRFLRVKAVPRLQAELRAMQPRRCKAAPSVVL